MSFSEDQQSESREKTVMATHCSHCGGTCLLKVHVKDGVITRIGTDEGEEPQYRACAKGRAYRQRVYAPDRLLYPLKRVGRRGEGRFERVSWDEALDFVAKALTRIRETYGPASIVFTSSGGDLGRLQGAAAHLRLLSLAGGCTEGWGNRSFEAALFAQMATYGTVATTNTRDDLLNSRLIIMWGWNPAEAIANTNTDWYLLQARDKGARIISIDPRYTDSAVTLAHQWIPIRPGTDAAMAIAMAYVIISKNLQDQPFLDTYTTGFERFKDYVLGAEDGVPKTPAWAEAITGVPAATIENLAIEYATVKPAALMAGIGPGRSAYGEQYHRATATLAAMTGNIGVHGGDAGVSSWTGTSGWMHPFLKLGPGMPVPPNPVESRAARRKNDFPSWNGYTQARRGSIHKAMVADAILRGKAGGYPADYKLLYVVNHNYLNQNSNLNKYLRALRANALEFIVVFEQFMTPGAKFADVILPVNTCFERNDITLGPTVGFYGFMAKSIDSIGESKSHLEICAALAAKMGISGYSDRTEEEWLKQIAAGSPDITDFAAFKEAGGLKLKLGKPYVAFETQINDPEHYPFPTPSGKIEIYCQRLADMHDPLIPAIPRYIEPWEGPGDPLARKYPLQLITTHFGRRAHTQYDNMPWMRELGTQHVWLNRADAAARSIKDGDIARVFNDRGVTTLAARVTDRIMPGVVDIPQGAWYDPDENGVDRGGCANMVTADKFSPAGAFPTNTGLVQVEKA